ncbi:MAG: SCO family protein [Pyrinomonadaceae bacterium]
MRIIKLLAGVLLLSSLILASGCVSQEEMDGVTAKRYPFKGEVLTVDKEKKKASIKHEKIEGYMEAMTMDFEIRKPDWIWNELVPGSTVTGELVVDNKNAKYWLELTGVVAPRNSQQNATALREDKAVEGKDLIDFELTDQDGKKLSKSSLSGKAVAITFIYAQCPLPEYCILMSKHFSDAANKIVDDADLAKKVLLVSVSFDPERDTPEKLRAYGLGYLGKKTGEKGFEVWKLASGSESEIKKVADFAGLFYERDKNNKLIFNHSLRTMLVAPDGKVLRVLSGNDWTPDDLIKGLREATEISR